MKNKNTVIEIKRLNTQAIQILKITNNINPSLVKVIFIPKYDPKIRPYDGKSLIALGKKIGNQIPSNIKLLTSITKFNEYTKKWFGSSYKCNICSMI